MELDRIKLSQDILREFVKIRAQTRREFLRAEAETLQQIEAIDRSVGGDRYRHRP